MYVVVFRSEARDELDEAYNWYESQQLGLGDEFLEYVDEVLNRICQQPELYVVVYRDVRRVVHRSCPDTTVYGSVGCFYLYECSSKYFRPCC